MRDEMANLAWAIERVIENPLEQPTPRAEQETESGEAQSTTPDGGARPPRYRLSSRVPGHWIPLLPLQTRAADGKVVSRLRRGAVLQPDGSKRVHRAFSDALAAFFQHGEDPLISKFVKQNADNAETDDL